MKRNVGTTIAEIFFPIFLLLVGYLIRLCFKTEKHVWKEEGGEEKFIVDKSCMAMNYDDLMRTMPMLAIPSLDPQKIDQLIDNNVTEAAKGLQNDLFDGLGTEIQKMQQQAQQQAQQNQQSQNPSSTARLLQQQSMPREMILGILANMTHDQKVLVTSTLKANITQMAGQKYGEYLPMLMALKNDNTTLQKLIAALPPAIQQQYVNYSMADNATKVETEFGLLLKFLNLKEEQIGPTIKTTLNQTTDGNYTQYLFGILNALPPTYSSALISKLMAYLNSEETPANLEESSNNSGKRKLSAIDDFSNKLASMTEKDMEEYNKKLEGSPLSLSKVVFPMKAGITQDANIPLYNGFGMKPLTINCYDRHVIALIGKDFPDDLKEEIIKTLSLTDSSGALAPIEDYKKFDSPKDVKKYIENKKYGKSSDRPELCFGVGYNKTGSKSQVSLHYFDNYIMEGIEDVPNNQKAPFEQMQKGPMMEDYMIYSKNGYVPMMNLLANYVLRKESGNNDSYIRMGMTAQKYDSYRYDRFEDFNGVYLTFFSVLAYLCPLILYILRMVLEKETKSKEGMKIMGLSDGMYFLSYFVQFFIVNIIWAFGAGAFGYLIMKVIPYMYIVLYLWLFGLCVFALAYFIQAFIDKTRLALIVGAMVYCLMITVAVAVYSKETKKKWKCLAAVFPPVNFFLGAYTMGIFKAKFYDFETKHVNKNFDNYSLATSYIMFTADFFIYLFLGFYFENVLPKTYGIARPPYFLFTPSYWCSSSSRDDNIPGKAKDGEVPKNPHEGDPDFQNEDLYKDKFNSGDYLQLLKIKKTFGDGKTAVNEVSFNLYRDEIFALLGHNGAGKTTLISMLTGMYEATGGHAIYEGVNILDDVNMDNFRRKLGICPQHDILFPYLTIEEHLELFCNFKAVPSEKIPNEVDQTLRDFRIYDIKDIIAKNLSAGQQRKLSIAIAVIGGSEVIFLDEPSSGMDITSRRNLWEILKKIKEKRIIILTTHYMEEASVLGSRIGILAEGNMKCIGTPLFLIERFGKFMSININKEPGAPDEPILSFFEDRIKGVTNEKLSEEILFKIPKDAEGFDIKTFFDELDQNTSALQIKNYSAAMPTLEDVFLNVAVMKKDDEEEENIKFNQNEAENDRIMFFQHYEADYTSCQKFTNDINMLFYKRFKQVYRDIKTFILEFICPILLTIIGCAVVQINLFRSTDPFYQTLDIFGKQKMFFGSDESNYIDSNLNDIFNPREDNLVNVTVEKLPFDSKATDTRGKIIDFMEEVNTKRKEGEESFAAFYIKEANFDKAQYEVYELINARGRQAPAFYTPYFYEKILKKHGIEFDFVHYPLPMTPTVKDYGRTLNNFCLVFFINCAFGLMPANFISNLVRERVNNSKHLMRIAGVSLFAYWMVNYIFEIVKYYVTAGICVLILWAFDFVPDYFWLDYLIYGPAMVSFTYLISYFFFEEAIAQNASILINLILGSLGSTVVIMLRSLEDTTESAKIPAYILNILPSFAFGYAYNQLLNGKLILFYDYGTSFRSKPSSTYMKLKYAGSCYLYMGIEAVLYMVILAILEARSHTFTPCPDDRLPTSVEDPEVREEMERANSKRFIRKVKSTGVSQSEDYSLKKKNSVYEYNKTSGPLESEGQQIAPKHSYSVKLKNVKKQFNKEGCCNGEKVDAIKNLAFCVEYGECFGLLGLNGAGKTTTFKCITQEHAPTHGTVEIDGKDISSHFDEIRRMFGYCPQFDAIFEFMTVWENLKFYARIKGVDPAKMDRLIDAMLESMMLSNYRNKVGGKLSGGNKRKLSVAISMICNPPIILLDEPSTGLDPEARRFMWLIIHKIATKRAKSSVIMTTHAMDEAETLCRRMAVMVNGEFVCLGTSHQIKERYGYGYEIDVRIKPLPQEDLQKTYEELGIDKHYKVTKDKVEEILTKIGKPQYIQHLARDKIGRKVFLEIEMTGSTNIYTLISWTHYVSNALKLINSIVGVFDEIILTEFIENNFLFKVKKGEGENAKTIGFLFSLLEKSKEACNITEYSIQQTSLEQIFNSFAEKQGKTEEELAHLEKKTEILITPELIESLVD